MDSEIYERAVADAKNGKYNDAFHELCKLWKNDPDNVILNDTINTIVEVHSIKKLFIYSIVCAVIGGVLFGSVFGDFGGVFSGIWLGSGLGCALQHSIKHSEWHDKHENTSTILFVVFLFGGLLAVLIRYLLKRKYIQQLKSL